MKHFSFSKLHLLVSELGLELNTSDEEALNNAMIIDYLLRKKKGIISYGK